MGPHFQNLTESIEKHLILKIKAVRDLEHSYAEDGRLEDLSDRDYASFVRDRERLYKRYFDFLPKLVSEYSRNVMQDVNSALAYANKQINAPSNARRFATPQEKVKFLQEHQKMVLAQLRVSVPELASQLVPRADISDYGIHLVGGSGVHSSNTRLIPNFRNNLSRIILVNLQEMHSKASEQLYQLVNDQVKYTYLEASTTLTQRGYRDALSVTGSIGRNVLPEILASREQDEKDTEKILSLFGNNPMNWTLASGPFKGKTLSHVYDLVEKDSERYRKIIEDIDHYERSIRSASGPLIEKAQSVYDRKRKSLKDKFSKISLNWLENPTYEKELEALHKEFDALSEKEKQGIQRITRNVGKNVFNYYATRKRELQEILREKKRAATWILNTHATLMTNPMQLGSHFQSKGGKSHIGGMTRAFRLVFKKATESVDMVGAAEEYLGLADRRLKAILHHATEMARPHAEFMGPMPSGPFRTIAQDIDIGDLDLTYIRTRYYKDSMGRPREVTSAYRRTRMPREGEGFAVSDAGKRRVYKPRRRDFDAEQARNNLMEQYGLSGRDSMLRKALSSMDPNTRNKYQRILDKMDKIPRKGAVPMVVQRRDGSVRYAYDKGQYREAMRYLSGEARRIRESVDKASGITFYGAISFVQNYLENKAVRFGNIEDVIKAREAGIHVPKSKNIRGEKLKASQDEHVSYFSKISEYETSGKEFISGLISSARTHEELQDIHAYVMQQVASNSKLSLVFNKNSKKGPELHKMMNQAIQLAELMPFIDKENFPGEYKGPEFPKSTFQELTQRASMGEYPQEEIKSFHEQQAAYMSRTASTDYDPDKEKNPEAYRYRYSYLPINTQVMLRKAELDNSGSTK